MVSAVVIKDQVSYLFVYENHRLNMLNISLYLLCVKCSVLLIPVSDVVVMVVSPLFTFTIKLKTNERLIFRNQTTTTIAKKTKRRII